MPMIVLIADKFEDNGILDLRAAGSEVTIDPSLKGDALREAIIKTRPAILIVRSTKVTADMIEATDDLALIIRAGAGYNPIVVASACRRGVPVANCPGKNAVAVAELAMALILSLDRRVADNVAELRNGRWNKKEFSKSRGLKGRTLGVIGTGEIGRAVIRRALAFEMNVVAYSRSLTDELAVRLGVERCANPGEVAERCDILSLHIAAKPETRNLINAEVLGKLRPGSYLINTARADVLDYGALAQAVRDRDIRVGLDVYPNEPSGGEADFVATILEAGGVVYGTHHIGASTDQAQKAIATEAVRIARIFTATGEVPNCVNIESRPEVACTMVVRHYDKVGVLAGVLDKIRRARINVEEMSNTIYQGRQAAVAVIRLSEVPGDEVVASIAAMKDEVIKIDIKPVE